MTHDRPSRSTLTRRALRMVAVTAAPGAVLASAAVPAVATPTAWGDVPEVSVLGYLLVLVILPVGLALVITLLSLLPSLAGGGKDYEGGAAWRGEPEWFGSPTKGLDAADDLSPEQLEAGRAGTGGTSGSW